MKKYIASGKQYIRRIIPSYQAPRAYQDSIQAGPNQNTGPSKPYQPIDFSQAGPVLDLVSKLNSLTTVKLIEVKQPGYILRAPPVNYSPDYTRNVLAYAADPARTEYDYRQLNAPPVYQSIPGYTVRTIRRQNVNPYYPTRALKAPRGNLGGGGCG